MGCCQARTNAHWATQSRAGHQGPGGPNLSDVCHAKLISMADTHCKPPAQQYTIHSWQVTVNRHCLPGMLFHPFESPSLPGSHSVNPCLLSPPAVGWCSGRDDAELLWHGMVSSKNNANVCQKLNSGAWLINKWIMQMLWVYKVDRQREYIF